MKTCSEQGLGASRIVALEEDITTAAGIGTALGFRVVVTDRATGRCQYVSENYSLS
ncbi:hypothetical protein [Streptomyces sp. NPDC021622]|uniref:hypothetical protein n=1 Tax=Streptomyces sp. NPDC021622 TaxID=3155013 RepID=UPI0033C18ED7